MVLRNILHTLYVTLLSTLSPHHAPQKPTLKNNILLIVVYTAPYYTKMSLLKAQYKTLFANVVFYGPEAFNGVVVVADINNGDTAYVAIADAMQKYSTYDGYLMIYNYRSLTQATFQNTFNPQSIWLNNFATVPLTLDALTQSPWWHSAGGLAAAHKVLANLPAQYRATLTANCGENIPVSAASMIYLPTRFKEQVKQISDLCYQYKLNSAIAYPLIAVCLDTKEHMEKFATSIPWI